MKALTTTLLFVAAMASAPVLAQTKPAARSVKPANPATAPAARPTTAKTTAAKTVSQPAVKPAATAKPTPKPAPVPSAASAPIPAQEPAKPTGTSAKSTDGMAAGGELFRKGTLMGNLGIGLGLGYGYYGTLKATPALSLSVERGVAEGIGPGTIGIGGLVGYKAYHYNYPGTNYKSTWTNIIVAARGTYHYNILQNPKLDTYGGLSLGVRIQKWNDTYYDEVPELSGYSTSNAYLTSGIFVGARYFFSNNIGAFTELGYDMNYLKIGVTAKF